ncbi:hypothetical protein GKQ77_13870 [Streptomyces sp. BG9H]|uniref:Integral membrane protein n=1 Tax=Streptomyces anatolicus TaxID=2675858 RepID=A0ABS6YQ09_9ACTN|nr:hypothetical protein [Streptomyces anatolicus]MBW5422637.1 hypothetical protein [Streptomyces anatolicus]
MSDVTEIRVHGVSGTPPESLLEVVDLRQVDGDDTARFLQRSVPPPEPPVREAFHWGNMTSGSIAKAMWLLLAPFGLINLARYTLPMAVTTPGVADTEQKRWARVTADVLLRLLGLVLTLLLTAALAFVALDLIAWQCGNSTRCVTDNSWLPFSDTQPLSWRLRMVMGVAPPVVLITLLVRFGRQVYLYPPPVTKALGATQPPMEWLDGVGALAQKEFWAVSPRAPMLRLFHTTACVALLSMLVAFALSDPVAGLVGGEKWVDEVLRALFGAAALIGLLCAGWTAWGYHPKGDQLTPDPTGRDAIKIPGAFRVVRWLAWGVLLAVLVIAFFFGPHYSSRGTGVLPVHLSGFTWVLNLLYAAAALLLLLLGGITFLLSRLIPDVAPRHFRRMWGGMACPTVASLAVLLGTGFSAGSAIQMSRLLGDLVQPKEDPGEDQAPLVLPDVFHVTALLWAGLVAAALLCVLCLVFWYRFPGLGRPLDRRIRDDYKGVPCADLPKRTVSKIAKAWRLASLKYRLPCVLVVLSSFSFVFSLAQGYVAGHALWTRSDALFQRVQELLYDRVWFDVKFFGLADDVGAWALTALAAALAFVGMRAFRDPRWQRPVGVVWDLLAFWPRLAHPIVPPPYGGRAVLALAKRVQDKTGGGGGVVLSGHSQGSVICVAAVLRVGDETAPQPAPGAQPPLSRVALLTHGSQLLWAYSRLFPAYLGQRVLRDVYEKQLEGRWLNLHRWSDYLGGPVLARPASGRLRPTLKDAWESIDGNMPAIDKYGTAAGPGVWYRAIGPEIQLRDPHQVVATDGYPVAPLLAHSSYYADPAYGEMVRQLINQLPG